MLCICVQLFLAHWHASRRTPDRLGSVANVETKGAVPCSICAALTSTCSRSLRPFTRLAPSVAPLIVLHSANRRRATPVPSQRGMQGRSLRPKPPGSVCKALDALRTTLAEASGFDPSTSQRRFRISIPHPMGPFYALDLLKAATAIAPGMVLTFDTVSRPIDLEENLRDGYRGHRHRLAAG